VAESEGASKTEEATPRKLDDARKKGDVAKSADIAPFAALAAAVAVLAVLGGPMSGQMASSLAGYIAHAGTYELSKGGAVAILGDSLLMGAPLIGAVMLASAVAGAAGNLLQHGMLWSPEKLKPDLKKLSPIEGFKRLFGPDALIQFAKTFVKLLATGAVAWFAIRAKLAGLQTLPALAVGAVIPLTIELVMAVTIGVLLLLATVAGADFFIQRIRFAQKMKMTREEVKDDHKQSDGDPHIKAKLRQQRMERSRRR
jgi:flagellar biosynthetic protein FlhB